MTSTTTVLRRLVLPVAMLALSGCGLRGSGTAATELREVESFAKIDLSGAFELVVHVEPGVAQKVEVTADDNIVGKITTTVSGNELDVELDDEVTFVRPKTPLRVEVWTPSLIGVDASGASEILVEGLSGESFEIQLSGASDSTLRGAVDRFEAQISGAGDLHAKDLQAKVVELRLSGAGDATVWASESLDVDVSGAGDVTYFGNPPTIHKDIAGAGELRAGSGPR